MRSLAPVSNLIVRSPALASSDNSRAYYRSDGDVLAQLIDFDRVA
jgi:hypothetical protein